MKNNILNKAIITIINLLLLTSVLAQNTQGFKYQAVIHDENNYLITEQSIGMQISILQGSADGIEVYIETQTPVTDTKGLVNIEIGTGTVISGDFASINWENSPYFLKIEVDIQGGENYTISATNQLLSVPVALYAQKAGNTFSGNYYDLINKPDFSNWDTDASDDFNGNYNNLSNTPDFTDWDTNANDDFSDSYNDLTNIPEYLDLNDADDFSGDYNDLNNKPDFTDWDTNAADDFSGNYNDLTNVPDFTGWDTNAADDFTGVFTNLSDLPENLDINTLDDFSGDYNGLTNKPDFSLWDKNADNDFDGNYNNLIGAPINLSEFINDLNYLTGYTETDSVFENSVARNITLSDIENWNIDISTTNELQTISISNDTLFLSDGGSVVLPDPKINSLNEAYLIGRKINADQGAFKVNGTDGVVFSGALGEGTLPNSESNVKYIWYPRKAAFKAGYFGSTQSSNNNIGEYSFSAGYNTTANKYGTMAFGKNSIASFNKAFACGNNARATSETSIALGYNAFASQTNSIAIGSDSYCSSHNSIAIGNNATSNAERSFAIGYNSVNSGANSFAIGNNTETKNNVFAIGRYNLGTGGTNSWIDSEPLFEIGNGNSSNRSNAFTVYKNGEVEIQGQIKNLPTPTESDDIATKAYVDSQGFYEIGDIAQGGVVFYVDSTGKHGLVVSIDNAGSGINWSPDNFRTFARRNALFTGKANTENIIVRHIKNGDTFINNYAATVCVNYTNSYGDYSYGDWYLPSEEELLQLSQEKTIVDMSIMSVGGETVSNLPLWSSTEVDASNAIAINMLLGNSSTIPKSNTFYIRPVRVF